MDPSRPPGLKIGQIFLEQAVFKHREDHLLIPASTPAEVGDLQVNFDVGMSEDGKSGLVRIETQTKPENNPTYEFRVRMIALIQGSEGEENFPLPEYLQSAAFTLLFPFVREAVANLTARGRFGPVWINPANIAAVVEATKKQQASVESDTRESTEATE